MKLKDGQISNFVLFTIDKNHFKKLEEKLDDLK